MVKYRLKSDKCKDITKIIFLEADDYSGGLSDTVYEKRIATKEKVTYIYIIEKYMLRVNSNLAITFILEETSDGANLEIIAAGGATGIFGLTYESEEASLKNILKDLQEIGFEII